MRRTLAAIALGLTMLAAGCREPTAEERVNRRVVDALLTAITVKNGRLLERDARLAQERHKAGHLTDAQHAELHAVIQKARGGDWQGAEKDGYAFRRKYPFVAEGR